LSLLAHDDVYASDNVLTNSPDNSLSITTLSGKTYKRANKLRVEGDNVVIMHSTGINSISLSDLPDSAREIFGLPTQAQEKKIKEEIETVRRQEEEIKRLDEEKKAEEAKKRREAFHILLIKYPEVVKSAESIYSTIKNEVNNCALSKSDFICLVFAAMATLENDEGGDYLRQLSNYELLTKGTVSAYFDDHRWLDDQDIDNGNIRFMVGWWTSKNDDGIIEVPISFQVKCLEVLITMKRMGWNSQYQ
jgi:hypothetical protein